MMCYYLNVQFQGQRFNVSPSQVDRRGGTLLTKFDKKKKGPFLSLGLSLPRYLLLAKCYDSVT